MLVKWKQGEPIYLQLRDRLRDLILQGVYQEGEAVPSVRQLSADLRINPITVSTSLQLLALHTHTRDRLIELHTPEDSSLVVGKGQRRATGVHRVSGERSTGRGA